MNNFLSNFPYCRPRRLRQEDWIRSIVTENFLKVSDLILPIFLTYEANSSEIDMMPNIKRNNINDAVLLANKAYEAGIKAVAIFPEVPEEKKDVFGKEALNENNIVCKAVRAIKKSVNGIGVICDIALDPYTISGHDGILENNKIDNDKTVEAEILNYRQGHFLECSINTVKVRMPFMKATNGNQYVGNMAGYEFVTKEIDIGD